MTSPVSATQSATTQPLAPQSPAAQSPAAQAPAPLAAGPLRDWAQTAARWWSLARYHRKSQFAFRLVSRARRNWLAWTGGGIAGLRPHDIPPLRTGPHLDRLRDRKLGRHANHESIGNAQRLRDGLFCFLNHELALPDPVDWRLDRYPETSALWRFQLHNHDFLLELAAAGLSRDPAPIERAWHLVRQWIHGNPMRDRRVYADAWHPFCISRRLPVWIALWSFSSPPGCLRRDLLRSIFFQATFLERHLERDLGGNHLLENAKALALAGAFFDGPHADRWLRTSAGILRRQLSSQVLPHGEHFERSPMYHVQMIDALTDVADAVEHIRPDLSQLCARTAHRMTGFLSQVVHPDGQIPLLGDSCLVQSSDAAPPRSYSGDYRVGSESAPLQNNQRANPPAARRIGDYWTWRDGEDFLIFDAGPVGPDDLPAHAHADLLTFEASIGGRRIFVDSGVLNYSDDEMRRYCRSTAAHNVLEIDGQDQCDMWSRFRMGYRGWPLPLAVGESQGLFWARACHNAYRRLGVPKVGRWLACRPDGPWFCVDWAQGSGLHRLSNRLHLHPDVQAEQVAPDEVRLLLGNLSLRLRSLTPGQLSLATAWYCPEFGRRIAAPVVQWTAATALPAMCGWCLTWPGRDVTAQLESKGPGSIGLLWAFLHDPQKPDNYVPVWSEKWQR